MEYPVIFLSDLHILDEGDLERVNALGAEIRDAIGNTLPEKITLAFGGDIIEGNDIHPRQNAMVRISAREQADNAVMMLRRFIKGLRRLYEHTPIRIYWVAGNHGRTSKTAPADNNWDLVVGTRLKDAFVDDDMVYVHVETEQWHTQFTVQGVNFYMIHRVRAALTHLETNAKKGALYERLMQHGADVMLMGHFHRGTHHSHQNGKLKLVVNGAMKPCEPFYREENGYWSRPGQAIIDVPVKGVPMHEDVVWVRFG